MTHLEPQFVVPESALVRGLTWAKRWWWGWVAATAAFLGLVFCGGMEYGTWRSMRNLNEARAEIDKLRIEQAATTEALARAWENQQEGIQLILGAAAFLRAKEELKQANQRSAPFNIVRR